MADNSLGEMFLLDQVVNMSEANPPKKKLDIHRDSTTSTRKSRYEKIDRHTAGISSDQDCGGRGPSSKKLPWTYDV